MYYKELRGNELPVPGGMQTETGCPVSGDAAEVIFTSFRGGLSSFLALRLSQEGVGTGRRSHP